MIQNEVFLVFSHLFQKEPELLNFTKIKHMIQIQRCQIIEHEVISVLS